MRFHVLGPLRIEAGRRVVTVSSSKQRAVLAVLLLRANHHVAVAELIDQVWGGRSPASARSLVQTYVWRLRRLLDENEHLGGRSRIATHADGYELRIAAGELDAHVFEQLVGQGQSALAAGDAAEASKHLAEALALWSGAPFSDLDLAGRAAAEGGRLAELHRRALNGRIEADLQLGRHGDVAVELRALIDANPLDEQLHSQMMVALSLSGRRAEALQAYARARRLLADELGLEPGPRLRQLQAAVLRGDSSLPPCAPAASAADPATVRVLASDGQRLVTPGTDAPPKARRPVTLGQVLDEREAREFQSRRAETAAVWRLLTAGEGLPRVLRVHGPPGIGKTAFAHSLLRQCQRQGYPAVLLDSRDFAHNLAALSNAVAARLAQVHYPGNGQPVLLVLDTFEEMRDMERAFWDVFLPSVEGPVLVVLSGRQPPAPPAGSRSWLGLVDDLELRELSPAQSRRLLSHHGVRDPAAADAITAFARGNPLLLTVAARHTLARGAWDASISHDVAVSVIGPMTRESTDPGVRKLIEAASLVRTFNQELLTRMTGGDVPSAAFAALCALSVVRVVPAGGRLHDLVRESVAADLRRRAPMACQVMRYRAHAYLAAMAAAASRPGPYAQELLHLAASASPRARFYTAPRDSGVQVRDVDPRDLPRLRDLCRTGITRFGLPPAARIAQLDSDFRVAREIFAVATDETGQITGFAYSIPLSTSTWRTAAKTRNSYFATLPEPEMTDITAAPDNEPCAALVTGTTHLPGYYHVDAALRQALFAKGRQRNPHTLAARFTGYHLVTPDCPALAEFATAGHTRRTTGITLGRCHVDEWILEFGDHGFTGWTAELLRSNQWLPPHRQ